MHVSQVPEGTLLIASDDADALAEALQRSLEEIDGFLHTDRVEGASRSGRIMLVNWFGDMPAIPLARGRESPHHIADDLVSYIDQARYDPPFCRGKVKGWEIRSVTLPDGYPAAICWTTWI